MEKDPEFKINAHKLTGRGPRLMVESALASRKLKVVRVIVTEDEAVEDLREYFRTLGVRFAVDEIGDEHHFLVDFTAKA